jgi:hypothetical protein
MRSNQKKVKMARPRKELEDIEFNGWDQLDSDIIWASQEYCAEKLGISADTLAQRIREKYDMSFPEYKHKRQETLRINIIKKQYQVAMSGNVSMLIWLGKNMCGQSDKNTVTGGEEPIKLSYRLDEEFNDGDSE